jgi:hypothetical protein
MISPERQSVEKRATQSPVVRHRRHRLQIGAAALVGLWLTLLGPAEVPGQPTPTPVQPGGGFAFSYPVLGAPNMTHAQYVQNFNGGYHIPPKFAEWIAEGQDIRLLNPNGVYLKHMNLRTIVSGPVGPAEGHPDYTYVKTQHPEWIIKDATGTPVSIFGWGEATDFGNDAFLDWVLDTWMPNQYFDSTDRDPSRVLWFLQDNGNFDALTTTAQCGANNPVCTRYSTNEGVRTAWENMLTRFKARYPNKRIIINTGPVTYKTVAEQLAIMQRILSKADGYFSEFLVNDNAYWNDQSKSGKRTALYATMAFADWLAQQNKVFFPNNGPGTQSEPTPAANDYSWAFFNLMRQGSWQFYARNNIVGGAWTPEIYPEMTRPLGTATEVATQISTDVWRRTFTNAIAYVNLSDASVSIPLPATGDPYKNSLGQPVNSPLTLGSFSGLTVYKAQNLPASAPTNLLLQ